MSNKESSSFFISPSLFVSELYITCCCSLIVILGMWCTIVCECMWTCVSLCIYFSSAFRGNQTKIGKMKTIFFPGMS